MLASTYDPAGGASQVAFTTLPQVLLLKSLISPIMVTDILLSNIGPDYTLVWDIPPIGITLEINNPGVATDQFVFAHAAETLRLKNLVQPTINDFSLAQHDHLNAVGGGLVGGSNFAWVFGANSLQVVTTSWATAGAEQIPETAGAGVTLLSGGIFPVEPGQYEVNASLQFNCDDGDDADLVAVRWQRLNSTSGVWENILGT